MRRPNGLRGLPSAAALVVAAYASHACAQETVPRPRAGDMVFSVFAEQGPDASVQLINGVKAEKKDWPTIISATVSAPGTNPPETCSGTFIGPGIFLTAAHCFDQGPGKPLRTNTWLNVGGQDIQIACMLPDEYLTAVKNQIWRFVKPRVSTDFALCSFSVPAVLPTALANLQYENIETAKTLSEGEAVLLAGFGCTNPAILAAPSTTPLNLDGLLRIGDALITSVPSPSAPDAEQFLQIRSPLLSAPALCPGDSGGPLFSGATTAQPTAPRRLRAVNSTVQRFRDGGDFVAISRVAPLATASFDRLARKWLTANKSGTICGWNGTPGFLPCRD